MAFPSNIAQENAVRMVKIGLGELLKPFDGVVDEVLAHKHFDTMDMSVLARVRIAGESKAQKSTFSEFKFRDAPHEAVNFAIYDLLIALVPEEEIKEAVADELLAPTVLDHLERIRNEPNPLEL